MIRFEGAGVRYGQRWIFRALDLELRPGTCLALLGPNGRGKTTMIKAAIGAIRLTEGHRHCPGQIGYVPQTGSAGVSYSALDVVVMGRVRHIGMFGVPGREDYGMARDALDQVELAHLANRPFNLLSGGERQLVLLARALATGAETIVLDEPASALDLANQDRFLTILTDLNRRRQHAILFSTHLPQHALHVADETMLMLDNGEIQREATQAAVSEHNLARLYGVPVRRVSVADSFGVTEGVVPIFGAAQADR